MWQKVISYALNFKRRFIVEIFPALLVLFLFGWSFVCFVLVWLFILLVFIGFLKVHSLAVVYKTTSWKATFCVNGFEFWRSVTYSVWQWLTKWMNLNSNEIYRLNMKCPWRCCPALWLKLTSFCSFGGERLSTLWTMHLFVWFRCESAVRLLCTRLVAPFSAIHSVFIASFLREHLSLI